MRDMYISVHVPKTGGSSWAAALQELAGDGFVPHYSHLSGLRSFEPDADRVPTAEERGARIRQLLASDGSPVVVHGHFVADEYAEVFPEATFLVWLRDPVERVVSAYHHRVRSLKAKGKPPMPHSLEEFAARPGNVDRHSHFTGTMPIEAFGFVGILEQHERSMRLFEAVTGHVVPRAERPANRNPEATGTGYELDPATRERIEQLNARDLELYAAGRTVFEQLCERYGVEP